MSDRVPIPLDCAEERYRVSTEVQHQRSRIDIEVMGQSFLLHIETKVNATEGEDQTCREREDLKIKAASRGIPPQRTWGLYLTVDGRACSDTEKFRPISWRTVGRVIADAAEAVKSRHPQNTHLPWVLSSYSDTVKRHVIRERAERSPLEVNEWPKSSTTSIS